MRELRDRFGRVATDLRVSLTDRCNLRCTYCMPEAGMSWLPRDSHLTDDEVVRLIHVAVTRLGITEVRLTGGEPLLRPGLTKVIERISRLTPRPHIAVTTNAIGLERMAGPLKAAGLNRVNVSLDTLDPLLFQKLTRRDRLDDVLAGLAAAAAAELLPIKVNAVLMRGVNDHEAASLLDYALERGYELRFIEQMPLDAQHAWSRSEMMTANEILARLRARFRIEPDLSSIRGSAPAELFLVDGGPARVGVIASVTKPFCGDCDRTRLTADGQIRNCLFSQSETDLRGLIRQGASDDEIVEAWQGAMLNKQPGHGVNDVGFLQPPRSMSAIGG